MPDAMATSAHRFQYYDESAPVAVNRKACRKQAHDGHAYVAPVSGIPLATRLLRAAAGYDLYKGVQMPFGRASADFACAGSDTSKNVCELPGDVAVRSLSFQGLSCMMHGRMHAHTYLECHVIQVPICLPRLFLHAHTCLKTMLACIHNPDSVLGGSLDAPVLLTPR
jgi:hypothetical protein